jgi:AAT family amino acid transporter
MAITKQLEQNDTAATVAREGGLSRQLTARQMGMIAIGGAIGTGLFLGSALAVRTAGPGVILSYLLGAVIALLMMGVLSEMAVAHPTAGSFGLYAELYVSRWAGFAVRYTYWAAQCIAIGGEATAVATYCQWWFPQSALWIWVVASSGLIVAINAFGVGGFGEFEYWFSSIKVTAIIVFIAVGIFELVSIGSHKGIGFGNFTEHGGFLPFGLKGVWMAMAFVIFSYIGTEVIAVTAGEAKDPQTAIPRALRSMVSRLILFYIGAMVVLVGMMPWNQIEPGAGISASPFVRVFESIHIPAASHIMNAVVLTAALSSMNCNLYLCTRTIFSLSRGGYAPEALGRVTAKGVPVGALVISTAGILIASVVAYIYPQSAYVYLFGIALFGALFVWFMIFVTHLFFRRAWVGQGNAPLPVRMIGYPFLTVLGAALILAILISTIWVEGMQPALQAGLPWLAFISLVYFFWMRKARSSVSLPGVKL